VSKKSNDLRKLFIMWRDAREQSDRAQSKEISLWNKFLWACNDATPEELDIAGLPAAPASIRQMAWYKVEKLWGDKS
jgi:hypothetical protein